MCRKAATEELPHTITETQNGSGEILKDIGINSREEIMTESRNDEAIAEVTPSLR